MTEGTDAPEQGGDEIIVHDDDSIQAEAPVAETSEDATEQDTGTEEETGQADEASDTPKRKPWWEKRFDELTAKKYDAERQAEYWRGVAEGRIQQPQQPEQPTAPPDRWEDPEGYDRWLMGQVTAAAEQRAVEAFNYQRIASAAQQFKSDKADYDETINVFGQLASANPGLIQQMQAAPNPAQFAYDTAKQAIAINQAGGLEAYIEQQAATRASTPQRAAPPAPPKTVAGISSGTVKDPEAMSMSEYIAWRKAQET